MLRINDEAPNFTAETTQGTINFHEWIGDGWAILFSHPKDFTPGVHHRTGLHGRTAAGIREAQLQDHRAERGSGDQPRQMGRRHRRNAGPQSELPDDRRPRTEVAKLYDMLPADAGNTSEGRTAATNATVRTVFVVGPDKKIKLMLSYPMSTGRNFDEVLRVLDSIQLTAKHKVATPVNWKHGEDVIILPSVSEEEAKQKYPGGWNRPSLICGSFRNRSKRAARALPCSDFNLRGMAS